MSSTEPAIHSEFTANLAALVVLLAAPFFALLTFQHPFLMNPVRTFSLPLLLAECVVIALAIIDGFRLIPTVRMMPRAVLGALGVWLAVAVVASSVSSYPLAAWVELTFLLIHLLFAIALFDRLTTGWKDYAMRFVHTLAGSILIYIVIVHGFAAHVWNDPTFRWVNIGIGAINVRHLGFYAVALIGMGLGSMIAARERRGWIWAAILLAFGYYFAAWSGGRNPILVSIVGTAIMILMYGKSRRILYLAVAVGIALPAMLLTLVSAPPDPHYGLESALVRSDPTNPGSTSSLKDRWSIWAETIEASISERPLIGHGRGSYHRRFEGNIFHPHNLAVQLFYVWGAIGTLAILALGIQALRRNRRWVTSDPQLALPTIGALGLLVIMAGADGPFHFGFPLMVLGICSALLCSINASAEIPE